MKANGKRAAAAAVTLAQSFHSYKEMDCQALVERAVQDAGGAMDYRGSNDMARNLAWMGTLENALAEGRIVPGALLFIHEEDESGLPARYRGDGLGDFSHVGLYVGENALRDTDKNGRRRECSVVHSSQSMGRVCGSTLKNGWTHAGWAKEIDYGEEAAPGVSLGAEIAQEGASGAEAGEEPGETGKPVSDPVKAVSAVVRTPDGNPVKLRKTASSRETVYWKVAAGETALVEKRRGEWALVVAQCTDGVRRRAYMMSRFLEEN